MGLLRFRFSAAVSLPDRHGDFEVRLFLSRCDAPTKVRRASTRITRGIMRFRFAARQRSGGYSGHFSRDRGPRTHGPTHK